MHTIQLVTGISAAFSRPSGLPGAFQAALHGVLTGSGYEQAIRDTMSCGGCTCSRSSFIGACIGAQVLQKSWPFDLFDHIVLSINQSSLYVIMVKFFLLSVEHLSFAEQSIPIFHQMIMSYRHDRMIMQLLLQFCNGFQYLIQWHLFFFRLDLKESQVPGKARLCDTTHCWISQRKLLLSNSFKPFLVCKVNKWKITGYRYEITNVLLSFAYRSTFHGCCDFDKTINECFSLKCYEVKTWSLCFIISQLGL